MLEHKGNERTDGTRRGRTDIQAGNVFRLSWPLSHRYRQTDLRFLGGACPGPGLVWLGLAIAQRRHRLQEAFLRRRKSRRKFPGNKRDGD